MSEVMPVTPPQEAVAPQSSDSTPTLNRRTLLKGLGGAVAGAILANVIPEPAGAVAGHSQTAVTEEGGKCLVYVQEPFIKRLGDALRKRSIGPLTQKFLIERDC